MYLLTGEYPVLYLQYSTTKLATPCTVHVLSLFRHINGPPESPRQALGSDLSKSNTHNFVVVFTASGVDNRHAGLHEGVCDTSTRVTCHSPTSNVATLCSDRGR